jgi:hypothetical protein
MKKLNLTSITFVLAAIVMIAFSACDNMIAGSGNVITEERSVKDFTGIEVSGAFKVYLSQGEEVGLLIEADDNVMPYIETNVRGGTLHIGTRGLGFTNSTTTAHITLNDPRQIRISGAVKVTGTTPLEFEKLQVTASGASDLEFEAYGGRLQLKMSGASKANLSGEVEELHLKLSGASKLTAECMHTQEADIDVSGASSASISVEEDLYVTASGASSVRYLGRPNVRSSVSGAGKVVQIE